MAGSSPIVNVNILADTKKFTSAMKNAGSDTNFLTDGIKRVGIVAAASFAAATAGLVAFSVSAVKAASDLQETTAAVGQIFGPAAKGLEDFAKQAPTLLGQTQNEFLNAAKTFGIFGQAAGLTADANAEFSKELAILATDLASFNNTSTDDAITALGAALRGESEPIRRYGVLLDDATLKARAMEMGIYSGSGALTQQQRVLAAHEEILAQTTTQQGDFARTADGMANGLKILRAQFDNLKLVLGQALYPVMAKLIPVVTKFIENLAADPAFLAFAEALADTLNMVFEAIGPLLPPIMDLISALLPVFADLIQLVTEHLTTMLPALQPLIEKFPQLVEKLIPLADLFLKLVEVLLPPLVEVFAELIDVITSDPNFLKDVNRNFEVLAAVIEPIRWTLQTIADLLDQIGNKNKNLDSLEARARMGQTAVNPFSLAGPQYQGNWGGNFADGGIVMPRPGGLIGRIGEAGKAEAVIPLDRLETMIGKGSGTTVVIQGNVGWDPDTVARKIAQKQAQINGLAGLNGIIGVR